MYVDNSCDIGTSNLPDTYPEPKGYKSNSIHIPSSKL